MEVYPPFEVSPPVNLCRASWIVSRLEIDSYAQCIVRFIVKNNNKRFNVMERNLVGALQV